jgi:AcrR family transcriptional regulator
VTDTELSRLEFPGARTARRGPERREAICAAVFQLLGEVGYDRMTMDAVATRAHASKATIYRAWPDKPGLVAEALTYRFGITPEIPDTGSLRGDLIMLIMLACEVINSPDGEVMTGIMTAAARNPELARTLHECTYSSKHIVHETVIRHAADRGEIRSDPAAAAEMLHEVMHAMILARRLNTNEPVDETFAQHIVDDVLIPVLTHRNP